MKFSVLCVALCLGVVVHARPEGEASPVADPAVVAKDTAADPKPVEETPAEEEEPVRTKRWYYYGPGFGTGYGPGFGPGFGPEYNSPYPFDMAAAGTFGVPVSAADGPVGRTRYSPDYRTSANLNELADHTRRQEQMWQHQQWQQDQYNRNNFPRVIDTANFGNMPFNQGFPGNNFNNMPFNQRGFNQFDSRPEVIDTQSRQGRTRGMVNSPSGTMPAFAPYPGGWQQPDWNPNFYNQPPFY